jgi:hypothetical protein
MSLLRFHTEATELLVDGVVDVVVVVEFSMLRGVCRFHSWQRVKRVRVKG